MAVTVAVRRQILQDHLPENTAFCVVAVGATARGSVGFLIGTAIVLAIGIATAVCAFACQGYNQGFTKESKLKQEISERKIKMTDWEIKSPIGVFV